MKLDVHQHLIPPTYRQILIENGVSDVGGRAVPDWTPELAFAEMLDAGIDGAILSVSAPGTTVLTDPAEATRLARTFNDYGAELSRAHPDRIGYFATLPMPGLTAATAEAEYALDTLHADGVILLANARGHYLGQPGQEPLFDALNQRDAIVLIHPAELPGPTVPDLPPFAADFLLDTTRAAYLLVRHEIIRNYPRIRFILSHAGGFLPYAAHRMAIGIAGDTGRSPRDILTDFRSFYFDTALSASPASLLALLSFAQPDHILYGSDWPFAPAAAVTDTFPEIRYTATDFDSRDRGRRQVSAAGSARPNRLLDDEPVVDSANLTRSSRSCAHTQR